MIVKNVKFINNKVEIVLDEKSFFVSKENYIENPIAIDSDINEDRINELLDYESFIENKVYLIKLLNKKALSEYEVYLKLKEREVKKQYIKEIIDSLKRAGLINDEFVALINLESSLIKRYGKRKIRKVLNEKRISAEIIDKILKEIDEDLYNDNFNKMVEKYMKMYDRKSFKMKQMMIKQKLEELGYEDELISKLSVSNNKEKELDLAINFLLKIIKNKNIDFDDCQNVNKIKSKLVMKGFSYDIINLAIEEVKRNETY